MEPCGSLAPELVQRLIKRRNDEPKKPLVSADSTPPNFETETNELAVE